MSLFHSQKHTCTSCTKVRFMPYYWDVVSNTSWFKKRKDSKDEDRLVGFPNARLVNFSTLDTEQHTGFYMQQCPGPGFHWNALASISRFFSTRIPCIHVHVHHITGKLQEPDHNQDTGMHVHSVSTKWGWQDRCNSHFWFAQQNSQKKSENMNKMLG